MDFKGLKNINIDKKYKIAGAIIGGLFAAVYLAFLILPHLIDLNKFMPMISDEVQKISGFKISVNKPKLSTTLRLGAKIKADRFQLNYKDNSPLIDLKNPEIEINLPSILIGHINLDKIKADELDAYLIFTKDKKYTVMEYADNIIKNTTPNEETAANKEEVSQFNFPIEIKNVNIKADKIALHLLDENVNKTYLTQFNNSSLLLKSLNGPLSIKTNGFIGIENTDKKFVNFDINFKTKLPKFETLAQNTDKDATKEDEEFELNFNPFKTLDDFNFRSDIFADFNIKNIENFSAKGDVTIDKFSLKLDDIQLPNSYLNLNFKNKDINIDSRVFAAKEEFIQTKSSITTGKKSKLNLNIITDKITIKSLKDIIGAILNICCIENDIKSMTAAGYINGDFNLDTDFKTIKSNGELKLVEGNIGYSKAGLAINQMQAFLDFSDNALNIKDTSATINGAKFSVNGEIASNADVNLTVKSDPLKIKDLINIATEFKIVNKKDIADFNFENGALTVLVNVLGDFKNIQPKADINLNNFKMTVKSLNMPINIDDINIIARPKDKNNIDAAIEIKDIKANMKEPALAFSAPNAKITADMKNINIQPLSATLEGTKINVSGDISDYMTKPEMDIKINGNVHPNTVLAFIPKEFRGNIDKKGSMAYNALISGAVDNIKITGNLISNPANYISIIEIPDAIGKENTLSLDVALKNDVLELNEISAKSSGVKIANIKGQIKNIYAKEPFLSNIDINIPSKTNIVIPVLNRTSLNIVGNIMLSGKAFSPDITGNINIDTLKYPDFDLTLESLILNFNKSILGAKAHNIKTANSDFSGDALISTNFNNGITINNLNFSSGYIDSDALIKLAEKAASTMPASAQNATVNSNSAQSADLGIIINGGQAKITKLKSGTLNIENINYEHTLLNNVYKLNNLTATFAQGTASGNCSYNIINGKIAADMQAVNIAMKDAAKAFIGIDIVRSGTLDGTAKVTLSGATLEEQLKTLNGTVSFEVKDGEYGESISFGRFINAANVLNLTAFSNLLNNVTTKINSFNTQEFKNINGILTFNKGIAGVSSFKSQGPNMSLYANGTYNLLNNNANLKVTGKVSSKVASTLGDLGTNKLQTKIEKVSNMAENAINKAVEKYSDNKAVQAGLAILGNLKNGSNNSANDNTSEENELKSQQTTGQIVTSMVKEKINPLFGNIQTSDIANIPPLSTNETENTKNFQVTISGLITNPKSIKTLKFQNDGSTNNINNQTN